MGSLRFRFKQLEKLLGTHSQGPLARRAAEALRDVGATVWVSDVPNHVGVAIEDDLAVSDTIRHASFPVMPTLIVEQHTDDTPGLRARRVAKLDELRRQYPQLNIETFVSARPGPPPRTPPGRGRSRVQVHSKGRGGK